MKFPRLSPILLQYYPEILIPQTYNKPACKYCRSPVSPGSVCSDEYRCSQTSSSRCIACRKSRSPFLDEGRYFSRISRGSDYEKRKIPLSPRVAALKAHSFRRSSKQLTDKINNMHKVTNTYDNRSSHGEKVKDNKSQPNSLCINEIYTATSVNSTVLESIENKKDMISTHETLADFFISGIGKVKNSISESQDCDVFKSFDDDDMV